MKDLTNLFDDLKLLYYEYDIYQNKFIKDTQYDKDTVYNDFIKLTHELSKNGIEFFIDENSDVVISKKTGILRRIGQQVENLKYRVRNSDKNIFILNDQSVKYAKNIPLIKTTTLKSKLSLDIYDAIIFTSKNGVKHLNSMTNKWKNISTYAISTQTAKEVKKLGGKLTFVGKEKHGDEFALELVEQLSGKKKIAYIGAKDIVSNIKEILKKYNINCDHLPVYETKCVEYKKKIDLPDDSIIIFSSPSTVKCFFKNVQWKDTFKAISIGNTTKKSFPQNIIPIVSNNTTLQSCVQKAINIYSV
ncbi:uroporphyrinogen-III synthase [Sulfurimonas lithotrophica]|nr:uroporphyrinogen-III synthase [Sulfurimonas lithotrophica]